MRKVISAITAAALSLTALPLGSIAAENEENGKPLKVLCIGDSITDGYVPQYEGSYRKFLYNDLTKMGYDVDMVGTKGEGMATYTDTATGESFEYDNANVGYSGYSIESYPGRNGIFEVLKDTNCIAEQQPDVITLMIGTNNIIDNHDMDETCESFNKLIDFIAHEMPENSVLLVSPIQQLDPNREGVYDWFFNYRHSPDWQTPISDEEAADTIERSVYVYDANILASVTMKHISEDPVYKRVYAMGSELPIDVEQVSDLLFDGVHPNNEGYAKIGHMWSQRIFEVLKQRYVDESDANQITVADLVTFSNYLLGVRAKSYNFDKCDMNKDGRLDTFDLVLMRYYCTHGSEVNIQ